MAGLQGDIPEYLDEIVCRSVKIDEYPHLISLCLELLRYCFQAPTHIIIRVLATACKRSFDRLAQRRKFRLALFDQAQAFADHLAGGGIAPGLEQRLDIAFPAFADRYVHRGHSFRYRPRAYHDNTNCAILVIATCTPCPSIFAYRGLTPQRAMTVSWQISTMGAGHDGGGGAEDLFPSRCADRPLRLLSGASGDRARLSRQGNRPVSGAEPQARQRGDIADGRVLEQFPGGAFGRAVRGPRGQGDPRRS